MPHFMGIDVALVNDMTAVAIGHIEGDKIVTDLVEAIQAGVGKYAKLDRLDFDEVAEWVHGFTRKFYIVEGMFDQWSGIPFEQALTKKGLAQLKSEHMTKNKTSEIWQNAKDMLWDKRLVLFDYPIPEGQKHSDFIAEMLELQATYHSKYVTTVAAPNIEGKHDDRSDAWARMVWLASQHLSKPAYIAKGGGSSRVSPLRQLGHRETFIKGRRKGSSPERQVARVARTIGRR